VFYLFYRRGKKKTIIFGFGNDHYENSIRFLFEYYIKNYHEKYNIYGVFTKNSLHSNKIEKKRLLYRGNLKTYLLFYSSNAIIFAFGNSDVAPGTQKYVFWVKKFYITHGMEGLKNIDFDSKNKPVIADIAFAASEYEKQIKNKFGNYREVFVTGYPRFDYNSSDNQQQKYILILLTWRDYITTSNELLESDYLVRINAIINDLNFAAILEKYDYYCYIKIHSLAKKLYQFTNEHDNRIITDQNIDFATIIKQSFVLITDYSSLAWDFIYYDKPVIFYQFDKKEYEEKRGALYTNVVDDKIGFFATDHNILIKYITYIIENDIKINVIQNKNKYFRYTDNNNTIRVVELIEKNI
jgi:CDP-glycerol glycerophosphotransferase (TagB/SpsB family)